MKPFAKITTILAVVMFAVAALPFIQFIGLTEASGGGVPKILWQKTYNVNGAYDAIQTSDGGYAITSPGSVGYQLVKFDPIGDIQWSESYSCPSYSVYPKSLVQTADGGYAIVGWATSPANGYTGHVWLVKTTSDGKVQWDRILGDNQGVSEANSLIQTSDGGYLIAGDYGGFTGYSGPGGWNYLLMKTDSNGNLQWTKIFGGPNDDRGEAVVQTSDGGYALAGCTSIPGNTPQYGLVKTDAAGNIQWNQSYSESIWDWAYGLTTTSDGGYALVGTAGNSLGGCDTLWLVKTDSKGTMQWNKNLGNKMGWGSSVIQTTDGGYAVSGGSEFQLAKTDANGNLQWTYNNTIGGIAFSVIQTFDGNFVIAGQEPLWIAKISDGSGPIETSPSPQPTVISNGATITLDCQSSTTYTNFKVNIRGTLAVNNMGVPNEPIQLSYSVNGGASWEALTYLSTDDTGAFQAVWTPTVTGNYYIKASYSGNSELAATSATVYIAVIPFEDTSVFSVASNSTVTALAYNSTSQSLSFKVSGETGTTGYSDVYISKSLLSDPSNMHVYFDQELLQPTTQSVGDSWLVYFNYHHSVHSVSLAFDSSIVGTSGQPQNVLYVVAGLVATVVLAVATIAIVLQKSKAKSNAA